jgi:hypothetical protein
MKIVLAVSSGNPRMFYPEFFTRSMQAGKTLRVKNGRGDGPGLELAS